MSSNNSKQKTNSTTTGTTTTTPNMPDWAVDPFKTYAGNVQDFMGENFTPPNLGPSTQQGQAWNIAQSISGGGGSQGYATALDSIRGLLSSYQPSGYNANGYNANGYNANGYNASGFNAGQLADTDISRYMNPYQQNVIDLSLNDLERGRQGAIATGQAAATQAGAYGGSRHGVADSLTNREFADSAGLLSANLRNQGYQNAQQAAFQDIGNRMTSDAFNANAMNQAGQFNSDAMNTAGQFNANAMNQSGLFNASAMNDASRFNASAMNDGANFRLNAANSLGQMGLNANADMRANAGLLSQFGNDQRQIDLQNNPYTQRMLQLAVQQGLLSGIPLDQVSGQTTTGNSTTNTTTKTGSSGLDWLNGIGNFIGAVRGK